jgi:hypothetical protein
VGRASCLNGHSLAQTALPYSSWRRAGQQRGRLGRSQVDAVDGRGVYAGDGLDRVVQAVAPLAAVPKSLGASCGRKRARHGPAPAGARRCPPPRPAAGLGRGVTVRDDEPGVDVGTTPQHGHALADGQARFPPSPRVRGIARHRPGRRNHEFRVGVDDDLVRLEPVVACGRAGLAVATGVSVPSTIHSRSTASAAGLPVRSRATAAAAGSPGTPSPASS